MDEDFLWLAEYVDGTSLREAPGFAFKHIDLEKLIRLRLLPQRPGLPRPSLEVSNDMRPIFFRRRSLVMRLDGTPTGERGVVTCLGWQKTVKGVNVQSLAFYFSDGTVVQTDDYNAI